ncbi:flagellar assembly peptidoglycan hydrolase FlgJ [Pseudoalteromonas sp. T1lg48]|uniref:flagellar assembly peptidoglycan hydrolase FlgJ n=1 Tax=Pseudoalteromonas sp. T1lg48 TaxID=2077100 RepID=UPI000CF64080|nr:flagellar assembly peptidoglycan hydrolase FlgJ [Pseudoalteromonas sp. T1lg48]
MDANQLQQQSVFDLTSLDRLRQDALKQPKGSEGERAALKQAAQQFESIFTQMLLKSMRQANAAFEDENSPFNASSVKYFQDMHDQQLSSELSKNGSLGLADIIVQQLSPEQGKYVPAEILRMPQMASARSVKGADTQVQAEPANPKVEAEVKTKTTAEATTETPNFQGAQDFIEGVWQFARQAAAKIGVHPGVMVAQAALETGWGKHIIQSANGESSNNLFNIKAHRDWQGASISKTTVEYEQGVAVKRNEPFRMYGSLQQSFDDFVSFLQSNPRYQQALAVADKPAAFIDAISAAGYATDPNYATKVKRVLAQPELKALVGSLPGIGD